MRLISIEIKGFKSFANQTILNFKEQVTGVVGPNGSGKSNIVDAIRWVLGEQKGKELRLDQMSDVIFNGTKSRKPGGVAQVSMSFENNKGVLPTEYNQVTISRLLYRNGDSEYRLNNVTCRMKDIKSLLMDTGIGSNSYAIIALGMVDDILNDKEQARRRMFEQAAGISKFKIRKKETVNKLNLTTADLDRVEDLLFEISDNLKALEKQAKKAEKYLKIKDEYRIQSIQCAQLETTKLKEDFTKIKGQIDIEQDKYRQLGTDIISLEAKLSKEKAKHLEREQELSAFQKEQNALLEELRRTENEKSLSQQKVQFIQERITSVSRAIKEDGIKLEGHEAKIMELNQQIVRLEAEYATIDKNLEDNEQNYVQKKQAFEKLKTLNDSLTAQREEINRAIIDVDKDIAVNENNIAGFDRQKVQLHTEQNDFLQTIEGIKEKLLAKNNESASILTMIETLSQQKEKLEQQILEVQKKYQDKTQFQIATQRKIDSLTNEYSLLKSMIDSFEGYPESMKFLQTEWKGGLILLSDIIEVDDKYKLAIEQYLEPYLNHYVVRSVHEAYEAINVLKEAQKGKASFFILDRIKETPITPSSEYQNDPRVLHVMQILNYEGQYTALISHLFHDAYILDEEVKNLNSMDYLPDTKVLSIHGIFVDRGDTVYGGSVGLFEGNKLGRKKKLNQIEKEIERLQEQKISIDNDLKALKERETSLKQSDLDKQINTLRNSQSSARSEVLVLESQSNNAQEKQQNSIKKIETLDIQIRQFQSRIKDLVSKRKQLEEKKASYIANTESGDDLSKLNQGLTALYEEQNKYKLMKMQSKNQIDSTKRDLNYEQNRKKEISDRGQSLRSNLSRSNQEMDEYVHKLKVAEEALIILYQHKGEKSESFIKVEREYYEMRTAITELEDQIKELNKSQSQSQLLINNLKDKFTDLKLKINSIAERIEIEFKIKLSDAPAIEQGIVLSEELKMNVDKLRSRLYNYGEVNPMAVEAYNEMQIRHENITKQRDDILKAKESLLKTIKEIEDSATERYLASFNQVRENFREVFRSLFTEDDDCDLVLLDPEHPVDSQIDIIAKPKGKRPKSLSQLSGGEKTLTAIALLFGLYLLKPAPFCIFDEVDAPLDDANIQKFNRIIKKFSDKSQFIIVTHNKSTMADVDVLYGVYMQEQGVSGVAPVDLRLYKNDSKLEKTS